MQKQDIEIINKKYWLGLKEASIYCGLSTDALRELIQKNRLKAGGTTGKKLISRAHLDRQIEEQFPYISDYPGPKKRPMKVNTKRSK